MAKRAMVPASSAMSSSAPAPPGWQGVSEETLFRFSVVLLYLFCCTVYAARYCSSCCCSLYVARDYKCASASGDVVVVRTWRGLREKTLLLLLLLMMLLLCAPGAG